MRGSAGISGLAALAAALLVPLGAMGATFKPTRKDDPVPNGCRPHNCSLREAAIAANGTPMKKDVILLKRGTYELELGFGDAPAFQADGLDTFSPMEIRGAGKTKTRIDANGLDRPIEIGSGITAARMNVTLADLTLQGGDAGAATSGNGENRGGGIVSIRGNVTLRRVLITDNEAQFGGGISSFADGALKMKGTTISGNNAGEGGGIHIGPALEPVPAVRAKIESSTIAGNFAGKGAGILVDGNPGTFAEPKLKLLNSTLAGNQASAEAGGLMSDNAASVTLDHATIVDNVADSDNVGGGDAGGLYQHSGASITLDNSILARNTVGSSGQGPECGGTITGQAVAVEGQGSVICTFSVSPFAVIDPNDRRLGVLANNGGPTRTIKLLSGFIGLGFANQCPKRDQRGVARPPEDCDTGAFERKGP
jgi:hypothetical protein